jgi:arginine decarboxylase
MHEDEFCLDPTRMTLVCGTAGFDGTQFKKMLADDYDIQLNKTSRNSVLLQSNINNTRSDVAQLIRVLLKICQRDRGPLAQGGENGRAAFAARVKSLMTDVPDLPNFSHFHEAYRHGTPARRRPRATCARPSTAPTTPTAASTCRSTARRSTNG